MSCVEGVGARFMLSATGLRLWRRSIRRRWRARPDRHAMSGLPPKTQTRRSALRSIGGAGAAAIAGRMVAPAYADARLEAEPPLRSRARASGIMYGCAGAAPSLQGDAMMLRKMAIEANIFVPEGCLKWFDTEPHPGEFDFVAADSMAAFAAR